MHSTQSNETRDSAATLLSAGVMAYVLQTLGHEALGHGSVCLLLGGHVGVIAPLWMRCSIDSPLMVAAGPTFNLVAAITLAAILARCHRLTPLTYLLWLCCAFNALIFCGYLMVGGATTFGDWGVLLVAVKPAWAWRMATVLLGALGYWASLRVLALLYVQLATPGGFKKAVLSRRVLIPGAAAGLVAVLAEAAAGTRQVGGFALPLGCTLFLAWTLMAMPARSKAASSPGQAVALPISWVVVLGALLLATFFVAVVGRNAAQV